MINFTRLSPDFFCSRVGRVSHQKIESEIFTRKTEVYLPISRPCCHTNQIGYTLVLCPAHVHLHYLYSCQLLHLWVLWPRQVCNKHYHRNVNCMHCVMKNSKGCLKRCTSTVVVHYLVNKLDHPPQYHAATYCIAGYFQIFVKCEKRPSELNFMVLTLNSVCIAIVLLERVWLHENLSVSTYEVTTSVFKES